MNKLKELWGKNKVLIVLGIILVICLIAIIVVAVSFFFGGSESVYGDRLEEIETYPVTEEFMYEYVASFAEDETVEDVTIHTQGRVIYVAITFAPDTPLVDAESKAVASIDLFSEDILSYYDINFTLECAATENSDGFTIMGARNVAGSGVVWNNNTPVESEEE